MAVAVQSSSTLAWGSASNAVLTKPTGLIAGDLMIAHIAVASGTVTTLAGWTAIASKTLTADTLKNYVFYKTADSTDVAASNFTFTLSGSVVRAGGIIRIDGHSIGTPIYTSASDDETNATAPSFTNTVTPIVTNSVLLMLGVIQQSNSGGAVSGYAVTTSTPTFTEIYDFENAGGTGGTNILCAAYGTRSAVTATGNSTFNVSLGTNPDSICHMLAIPPSKDFTINDTVSVTDSILLNQTILIQDTVTSTDEIEFDINKIRNTTKNTGSFTNLPKHE